MAFIEASKTGSGGSGDGVPVGALMTFSGEELPEGYEPAETEEQISIQQLNDNLSGFKFYPTGTGIVGLISDDSAYTDADGNYVIWGTATANQLVEDNPNTYKSVPSTEDCRGEVGADTGVPFNSPITVLTDYGTTSAGGSPGTDTASVTITKAGIYEIFGLIHRLTSVESGTGIRINGTQVVQSNKGPNSYYEADLNVGDVVTVYTFNPNYSSGNRGAWIYVVG